MEAGGVPSVGDRCIAQYGRILEPSMRCGVPLECLSRVCLTGVVSCVGILACMQVRQRIVFWFGVDMTSSFLSNLN